MVLLGKLRQAANDPLEAQAAAGGRYKRGVEPLLEGHVGRAGLVFPPGAIGQAGDEGGRVGSRPAAECREAGAPPRGRRYLLEQRAVEPRAGEFAVGQLHLEPPHQSLVAQAR